MWVLSLCIYLLGRLATSGGKDRHTSVRWRLCAKGLKQGNSCLWQRIYYQLLVLSQANDNKLVGVFEIEKCTKESQSEELEAVDSALFS